MRTFRYILGGVTACVLTAAASHAEQADNRPAKALQDNSFLIEEAYNQERGVVQHIAVLRRLNHDWLFNFTQEWPLGGQTHQLSYTIPYTWLRGDEQRFQGLGDVMLNYRLQVIEESGSLPAFAPRFSVILPTGDQDKGLGNGSLGYQIMLPFSKIVSDRMTLHANAGVTSYFDVHGQQPTNYVLGGSAIYAVTREFNLMLEALAERNESVNEMFEIERETSFTVSPGMRYAFNLDAGQLVVGLAAPVQFTKGATDYGAMFYLSFEHSFLKK